MDKPERKPSEGVDAWNRSAAQKSSERAVPSHTDTGSPSAAARGLDTTSKLWADSLPPCEPVESPPKPAVTVPEEKPKSVSSDVKKEPEKKEVPGGYQYGGCWMFLQERSLNENIALYFIIKKFMLLGFYNFIASISRVFEPDSCVLHGNLLLTFVAGFSVTLRHYLCVL